MRCLHPPPLREASSGADGLSRTLGSRAGIAGGGQQFSGRESLTRFKGLAPLAGASFAGEVLTPRTTPLVPVS